MGKMDGPGKTRGRPGIKPMLKDLILAEALDHKAIPPLALAVKLKLLIEEMGEIPPAEGTMTKLISQIRNCAEPLDTPFSLGTVFEYDIPAEAIPILLEIQDKQPITIRQARWVAKLQWICESLNDAEPVMFLYSVASSYALRELAKKATGKTFDTSDLDKRYFEHLSKGQAKGVFQLIKEERRTKSTKEDTP